MTLHELEEFAGWLAAGALGAAMGVRKLMTNWAKERSTAITANVVTERAAAEIDVIALLREQVELLRVSNNDRASEMSQLRGLIHSQAEDMCELHDIVNRLRQYVSALEATLAANGIPTPTKGA